MKLSNPLKSAVIYFRSFAYNYKTVTCFFNILHIMSGEDHGNPVLFIQILYEASYGVLTYYINSDGWFIEEYDFR